jgi:16S rRNA (guanine527-N7)-methyltransferase
MTPAPPDDEGAEEAVESGGAASEDEAPPSGSKAAKPKKAEEDPDQELLHAETPVPSLDELQAAMRWAFAHEDVAPALLERFAEHARRVLEGNRRMNLTAVVDPREVAAKHYLDCWRATRLIPLMGRSLLDLGTGAGYPGIPVALAEPQARVVCVDSTKKRVDFVQETITGMEIRNASASWERGEEHLARHDYDIVLMRAISSVRENVRTLRKVKHSQKDVVMLKGPSWSREVRAAEREAERLGFRLDTVWEHALPEEMGQRAILVYRAPGGHGR